MSEPQGKVFYGTLSDFYDDFYRGKNYERECCFILKQMGTIGSTPRMLELGCGTGGHLVPFSYHGWEANGIDASCSMLLKAKEKLPSGILRFGDFRESLNLFPASSFDLVTSLGTSILYASCSDIFQRVCCDVYTLLKPGGFFAFDLWKWHPCSPGEKFVEVECDTNGAKRFLRAMKWCPKGELLESNDCFIVDYGERSEVYFETHTLGLFRIEQVREWLQGIGFSVETFDGFTEKGFSTDAIRAVFICKKNGLSEG